MFIKYECVVLYVVMEIVMRGVLGIEDVMGWLMGVCGVCIGYKLLG